MKRKIIALVVAIAVMASLIPMVALAEENGTGVNQQTEEPAPAENGDGESVADEPAADEPVTEEPKAEEPSEQMSVEPGDIYNISIAGIKFTKDLLTIDSSCSSNIISGSAVLDPENKTLTLDNFVYEGSGNSGEFSAMTFDSVIAVNTQDPVNIVIKGERGSITMSDMVLAGTENSGGNADESSQKSEDNGSAGEYSTVIAVSGDVSFTGSGVLEINNALSNKNTDAGICVVGKSEFDGPSLKVSAAAPTQPDGKLLAMYFGDDVSFKSGNILSVVNTEFETDATGRCGIMNYDGSVGIDGADVTVEITGTACDYAYGIYAMNGTNITGGSVTVLSEAGTAGNGAFGSAPSVSESYEVVVRAGESSETAVTGTRELLLTDYSDKFVQVSEGGAVKSYSVTFETNGGTINGTIPDRYYEGVGLTLPSDVTMDGFVFSGWYETADFSTAQVTEISASEQGDKKYYAKWTEEKQITVISSVKVSLDEDKLPVIAVGESIPEADTYAEGKYDGPFTVSDSNCYVSTASWMYKDEEGEWQSTHLTKAEFEEDVEYAYAVILLPKENCEFKPDESIFKDAQGFNERLTGISVAADKAFVMYYYGAIEDCLVSFETDGGTEVADQLVAFGGKAEQPEDPEKEGYIFRAWYSDEDLNVEYDFKEFTIYDDTVIYAGWDEDVINFEPDYEKVEKEEEPVEEETLSPAMIILIVLLAAAVTVLVIVLVRNHINKKKNGEKR